MRSKLAKCLIDSMIVFESYFIDLVGRKASYFLDNIIPKTTTVWRSFTKKVSGQFLRTGNSRLDFHYALQNGKMFFENIPNKFQMNSNRKSWRILMLSASLTGFLTREILLIPISGFCILQLFYTDFGLRSRRNGIL